MSINGGGFSVKNLSYIKSKDPRFAEALQSIAAAINTTAQQTGASPSGTSNPPPNVQQLHVTAANGIFSVSIVDNGSITKGINYFVEMSLNANFVPYRLFDLGASRTLDVTLGDVNAYWRAYSQYLGSDPSSPITFAGNPVSGGGVSPPSPTPSTGNGTSGSTGTNPGAGFGRIPYVSPNSNPGGSPTS